MLPSVWVGLCNVELDLEQIIIMDEIDWIYLPSYIINGNVG